MIFLVFAAVIMAAAMCLLLGFNPLAGLGGFVKIGMTNYAFTKWSVEMKCKILIVNNFTGGGYQQAVPGLLSATLTLSALTYDQGNMAFASGGFYTFILGYTTDISLTLSVYIESIKMDVDYEGLEAVSITGQSDGSFAAAIA